jgi:hypothetical protein
MLARGWFAGVVYDDPEAISYQAFCHLASNAAGGTRDDGTLFD